MPNDMTGINLIQGAGGGGKGGRAPVTAENTLRSNHIVRVLEAICEGPVKSISAPYLNETPLFDGEGKPNFNGVTYAVRLGLPDQPAIDGFSSQEAEISVDARVVKATPVVRSITDPVTDAARVQIKLPGLYRVDRSNGDMLTTNLTYRVQYRPSGGNWIDIAGSPFSLVDEKCTSPVFLAHRFKLTGNAPWEVRVVRETDDSTDSMELANDLYFFTYTQIVDQKFTYPHTALLALSASAEQFGESIPTRAVLVEGMICDVPTNFDPITRTYTGIWNGTFKQEWTDCPAWCLRAMIRNPRWGLGQYIPATYLNDTTLYTISQYCAQHVDNGAGGTEPRFTFNAYIATKFEAYQLLNSMASVFRGMIYYSLGSIMFTADMPRDPELTVTRANTVDGEFTYKGASLLTVHNRVNVTYNNPDNFYKRDVVTVEDPEGIVKNGLRPTDIVAFGCTSKSQALRAGRWLLYTERMESEVLSYIGGPDHIDIGPGSVVRVMDPGVMGVSMGGRLKGYTGTSVTLDRTVQIEAGETYELVVHDRERKLHYRTVTNAPGAATTISVSVPLPSMTANPVETVWALRKVSGPDTLWRVLASREVGKNQYEITALRHEPGKYAIIENGLEIPNFPAPLLPTGPLPVPQNLVVREFVAPAPGAADRPSVQVAFTRHTDPRVRGYELTYRIKNHEWRTVDLRMNAVHVLDGLDPGNRYNFRLRSYDGTGRYSNYTDPVIMDVTGRPVEYDLPNVSGVQLTPGFKSVTLRWTNPSITNFKSVEVWTSPTDVQSGATKAASTSSERHVLGGLSNNQTLHVWTRVEVHAVEPTFSPFAYQGSVTTNTITGSDVSPNSLGLDRMGQSVIDAIDAAAGSAAGDVLAAQAARDAAIVAQNNAVAAQNLAVTAKNDAQAAFTAADGARVLAQNAQTLAQTANTQAQSALTDAQAARNAAQSARDLALNYRDGAQTAQGLAQQANTDAQAALSLTVTARNAAQLAETNANTANTAAQAAKNLAETARTQAQTAATNAAASELSAATSAGSAVSALVSTNAAYAVTPVTQLRAPADAWTNGSTTATTSLLKAAAPGAQFITNDADFGDCYEFQSTGNLTVGQAYGFAYQPGRVYDVVYRFKVATGPCRARFGVTTQLGTAQVSNNVQTSVTEFNTAEGVITRRVRFGPSGTSTSGADALVVLPANAADRAYPFIRQNPDTTSGRLRVAQITILDVTESLSAAASASAAATNSTAAGVSATDAAQSANAAQIARTAAETARSGAESAQTSAATSATNAAGSASSASTSATNAANSATAAGNSASAASTSASQANTSATNAGQSATSAQGALVSARLVVLASPILPQSFEDGLSNWTSVGAGAPASLSDPSGYTVVDDAEMGKSAETTWDATNLVLLTRGVVALQANRIYRVTIRFKVVSTTGSATVSLNVRASVLTGTYTASTTSNTGAATFAPGTTVHQITRTFSSSAQTGVDQVIAELGTMPYARFGLRSNEAGKAAVVRIGMIRVEDVTESVLSGNNATNAAGSASAAASSASSAGTSATNAGTFASNASNSATAAAQSATNAGNSANAASTSASNAATSASAAGTSATSASNSANTASTQAGNAATSASSAATSASNALGSANSAATSAVTAANTLTEAQRVAGDMFPSDFEQNGVFWTSSLSGAPTARGSLTAAVTFTTVDTEGKVANIAAPQAGNVIVATKSYIKAVVGRRYRLIVRARHVGAFAGTSSNGLRLAIRRITSTFTAGTDIANNEMTFSAPNAWQDFVLEVVHSGAEPYLLPFTYTTPKLNMAGPVVQISRVIVQDVTSLVAAESAASAAATSATSAAASETAAGQSASAAQTARTGAETARSGAESAQTSAATSATNAAGSASSAATSATNAANSANTAGTQAAAATTAASNASTSATNASQSATAASNNATAARLTVLSAPILPFDFERDGEYWFTGTSGDPATRTPIASSAIVTDTDLGKATEQTWNTLGNQVGPIGVVSPVAGRVYRVTAKFKVMSTTGNATVLIGIIGRTLNSSYAEVASSFIPAVAYAPGSTVYTLTGTFSSQAMTGVTTTMASLATAPYVRFGLRCAEGGKNAVVRIGYLRIEDVTEEVLSANSATGAANSASAASTSASTAGTHATNAGTSATAAAASATTASTQAGNAGTSATQAATSATNAQSSATSAATSATTASNASNAAILTVTRGAVLPSNFQDGLVHWTTANTGTIEGATAQVNLTHVTNDPDFGNCAEWNSGGVTGRNVLTRGILPTPGRRIRVTATFKVVSIIGASTVNLNLAVRGLTADFLTNNYIGTSSGAAYAVGTHTVTAVFSDAAGTGVTHVITGMGTNPHARFGLRANEAREAVIRIASIRVEDVTLELMAQGSADAAATSATSAATSATGASQSASAAQTSATNASTSAGQASTSASQASTSASNALSSANTASTQATNATNSANTAGTHAASAASSASSASSSATNAAQSATSAEASMVSARLSIMNSPVLPYDFTDGKVHWTQTRNGAPNVVTDPGGTIVQDADLGPCLELSLTASGVTQNVLTKGVVTLAPNRAYRVTVKFKFFGAPGAANVSFGFVASFMGATYADAGVSEVGNVSYAQSESAVYTVTRTFSDLSGIGADTVNALFGTAAFARFGFRRSTSSATNASTIRIGVIQVQDVTQELVSASNANNAASSASAASGSANTAGTHATNAGTSATAASASANTAQTQAGLAATSASSAATSATNAQGSANSAATSATTAASTRDAVDRAAAALFPPSFDEDGRFFTSQTAGAPTARGNLGAMWTFSTITEGRIASVAAPQASNVFINPKGYIAAVQGRTYRLTVRVRHRNAFAGSSNTTLHLRFQRITSAFASGTNVATLDVTIPTINTWHDFSTTFTHNTTDPYLAPQVYLLAAEFGTAGPIIDIASIVVEDVTSQVAAQGFADAAATSASSAATSQTAAGNSASAAQTSATNAATQAGNASTSASQAATSASNALGSANAASTSATTAADARNSAVVTVAQGFPTDFVQDGLFFQSAIGGAPGAGGSLTGNIAFITDSTFGRALRFNPLTAGVTATAYHMGVVNATGGRRYRLTVRARRNGTISASNFLALEIVNLDAAYLFSATRVFSQTAALGTSYVNYTAEYTAVAGDVYLRFGVRKPADTAGTGDFRILSIVVEDITSENAASGFASAASTSASSASASANNAGQSAQTATTQASSASTSAANANNSAISAALAETNAAGSSAQALEYRNAAARLTSGGASKNPVFNDWSATDPANVTVVRTGTQTTAKVTTGVRYVNALQLNGIDTTVNGPHVYIDPIANSLDCVANPERVIVRAEVEFVSGSLSGGGHIIAQWINASGGTSASVIRLLTDFMSNETGKVQNIEWYVERPTSFVAGTNPRLRVNVFANGNVNGATRASCTIRVHRLDFEVVTSNSMAEVFQRAKVAVDGIQSAAVGLRAVAGSGGALLELVALDNPVSGAVSAARINADNIILDGSVKAKHLVVASRGLSVTGVKFSANPATNVVSWTAGQIRWISDAGNATATTVSAGSVTWTSGIRYIYFDKTGTLKTNTNIATAFADGNVVLATYVGGTALIVNYGGTVIDGGDIRTGSVTASLIDTASFSASGLALFGGAVQSSNYVAGESGWRINNTGSAEFNGVVLSRSIVLASGNFTYPGGLAANTEIDINFVNTGIRIGVNDVWTTQKRALLAVARFVPTSANNPILNSSMWRARAEVYNSFHWVSTFSVWNSSMGHPNAWTNDPATLVDPPWATGNVQRVLLDINLRSQNLTLNGPMEVYWKVFEVT